MTILLTGVTSILSLGVSGYGSSGMRSIDHYGAGCAASVVVALLLLAGDGVLFERLAFAALIVGQFLAVVFASGVPAGIGSCAGKLARRRRSSPEQTSTSAVRL